MPAASPSWSGTDAGQWAVLRPGQQCRVLLAGVVENRWGRTRDAAGDHDQIGIVDVTDHGQTHGQPTGELGDRCQREWVTVLRGVGDPATGERTRIHRYLARQDRRRGRVGGSSSIAVSTSAVPLQ